MLSFCFALVISHVRWWKFRPAARNGIAIYRRGDPILVCAFALKETGGCGAYDITGVSDTSEFSTEASCGYFEILGLTK